MDYARQIATARRLIEQYGADCVWADQTPGTPDPAQPWLPVAPAVVSAQVKVAFFSRNEFSAAFLQFMKGTEIPIGKQYGLMATPSTFIPKLTGTLTRTLDNVIFTLNAIDVLAPNGIPILYTIDLQK